MILTEHTKEVLSEETNVLDKKYHVEKIEFPKVSMTYLILKRAMDIIGASIGLILTFPIFFVIAICIKIDDRGSVIHTQTRVGKDGRFFKMHKFRSMKEDARGQVNLIIYRVDGNIPIIKSEGDSRITRVGQFIRKTGIDELMQLWDVLVGNMSLVGPRPALVIEAFFYNGLQNQRLYVKQGLTGYWQCYGRMCESYNDRINMDIEYIKNRGILTDIKILLATIPCIIKSKNLY